MLFYFNSALYKVFPFCLWVKEFISVMVMLESFKTGLVTQGSIFKKIFKWARSIFQMGKCVTFVVSKSILIVNI